MEKHIEIPKEAEGPVLTPEEEMNEPITGKGPGSDRLVLILGIVAAAIVVAVIWMLSYK